jgi:ATP-binding protein involved in chromosome partitioning
MITEQTIRDQLKTVRYPGFSRDIVSFGLVKGIEVNGADIRIHLALATKDPSIPEAIEKGVREALAALPGVGAISIDLRLQEPPAAAAGGGTVGRSSIPGVKRIIAVGSGKGGVGKSTISANLALALAATGAKVGLCDCDLYGPSMGLMFGTGDEQPYANDRDQIIPLERHGIKLMSMGFLLNDSSPVIVRGPMATRYTQQFLRQVAWGDLDYLVLDLPPGTGDIQLTIVQTVALDGAVIVTTPQEVALIDARKAVGMFDKVNVPILGLVENMSWFDCPSDGKRYYLFGREGGAREARRLHVPLLGQIPLAEPVREGGDEGEPVATRGPDDPLAAPFNLLAAGVIDACHRQTAPAGV